MAKLRFRLLLPACSRVLAVVHWASSVKFSLLVYLGGLGVCTPVLEIFHVTSGFGSNLVDLKPIKLDNIVSFFLFSFLPSLHPSLPPSFFSLSLFSCLLPSLPFFLPFLSFSASLVGNVILMTQYKPMFFLCILKLHDKYRVYRMRFSLIYSIPFHSNSKTDCSKAHVTVSLTNPKIWETNIFHPAWYGGLFLV